jgi:Dolichyl-phosphate-mannose-protein mannosyltransferase
MTLANPIRSFEFSPLHIIVLLALLQLLITLLTDGFALSFDEAIWHYIGRNWFRHGLIPYSGGVDNKSPLIFAIFGLSDKLFGVNYWFPRLMGILCQSIGLYYVFRIAKQLAGQQAGLIAISLYGLSLLWRSTNGKFVALTETFESMFIILSFYRYLAGQKRKDFFAGGIFAGLALGFRLSAVFGILALFIFSLRKRRAATLMFCTGIVTSIIFLAGIGFFARINIQEFIYYSISDNFGKGSATDHTFLWKLENFSDKFFYSELILFYPGLLGYLLIKKKLDSLVLWVVLEFIGINIIGIYDRAHLKDILPALSLTNAIAINYAVQTYKIPVKPVMLIIWIVFFPKLLEPLVNFKKLLGGVAEKPETFCQSPYPQPDDGIRKRLGSWVKSNTPEQERVLVAGFGAQVQVYSERLSPSIYFNATQTRAAKEKFYQDLLLNKPGMVLIPVFPGYLRDVDQDMRLFIDELVAKDYYFDRCMYGYNIFKIKKNSG